MRKFLFIVAILLVFLAICERPQAQVPVTISPVAKQCFGDANNDPLVGGKLYTYAAGTSTPLATYTSSSGLSQNTNPVVLDASGCTPSALFLSSNSYKFVLKTSAGVTLWTVDGITSLNILSSNNTWTGTNTFQGTTNFTGAVAFTNSSVTAKYFESFRFADQFAGGSVTAKINAALATCPAYSNTTDNSCVVIIPSSMGCGEPSQATDNIIMWDFRNCAQSQGLRFNLQTAASGNVRSKMFLGDNYNVGETVVTGSNSSASLYVQAYPDHPNSSSGTFAAINGSISINSIAGNMTGTLVGIEGEAGANATSGSAYTVADIRGGTFNSNCGGDNNCTQISSLYAQGPTKSTTGVVTDAISFIAEDPAFAPAGKRLAIWSKGRIRTDGNWAMGTNPDPAVAFFLVPSATLIGTTQTAAFIKPTFQNDATVAAYALRVEPFTKASAFTLPILYGAYIGTPTVGAGSTITTAYGLYIDTQNAAGTNNYSIYTNGTAQARFGGSVTGNSYGTLSNCLSAASPAVCGSAVAGSVVVAAGATTVVVNTSALGNNSQVLLTRDDSLSTRLSVTCNGQTDSALGTPKVTARSTGTSFTIGVAVAPTTDPMCISYLIVN